MRFFKSYGEKIVDKLAKNHTLSESEFRWLLTSITSETERYLAAKAEETRKEVYGTAVYIRGLIEIGNVCRNDCYYCGIRKSNKDCDRYVLTEEEILECCKAGYEAGFRTFVLQGGEGVMKVEKIVSFVRMIKEYYPDCAVTLSLGEYEFDDYKKMKEAGADRYLLRHETADQTHYEKLHPAEMSFEHRMSCLRDLKKLGFQVGCGMMVGSPFQTVDNIIEDLRFIEDFKPDMCGIGPFIPHDQTPFREFDAGSIPQTLVLLSIIRLIKPNILLPATTALGTLLENGRELGIKHGANVVMPNLSPASVRKKYSLYNGKISDGAEAVEGLNNLIQRMHAVGYEIVTDRGDIKTI